MDFSEQLVSKVKPAIKSPFRAKHINDPMFIKDFSKWHQ